jgi:imidazoleglycerol phosphate dehydratase HisB
MGNGCKEGEGSVHGTEGKGAAVRSVGKRGVVRRGAVQGPMDGAKSGVVLDIHGQERRSRLAWQLNQH